MNERVHFEDLTKINVPFGLLDDDTRKRVCDFQPGTWEFLSNRKRKWVEGIGTPHPDWGITYRAKATPLTKPSPPWEHLADWVQYVARDEYGGLFGYSDRPNIKIKVWDNDGRAESLRALKFDRGTCDWRDSLVKRPEGL